MQTRSAAEVWDIVLGELQVQLARPSYDTWLRGTRGLEIADGRLVVGAPSPFAAEWLRHRLAPLIRKTVGKVVGHDVELLFTVLDGSPSVAGVQAPLLAPIEVPDEAPSSLSPALERQRAALNPRYTFASFIVGSSNRFAHAASQAVADNPGKSYNPLFLYGGVGLGKTHLLHAIGHRCLEQHLDVLYTTSEQFTNEFIQALRERKTEDFRSKYRGVDVLLIDDIHFIADKEQTQESFFHTFNDLHTAGRQIVISSDRPPRFMPLLEDRLRSRFEWGLIADIQPPDLEMRVAILQSKADEIAMSVPPEVLHLIAHRFPMNIRELEGALNRVIAYSRMVGSVPTLELAESALAELLHQPKDWSPTPDKVLEVVSQHFGLTPEEVTGPRRSRKVASARQIAMYLLRHETSLSLAEIGRALGNRDHSTVLHGCEKIANTLAENAPLARVLAELSTTLRSTR